MKTEMFFLPIKFDWVAIHPAPIGIIQFIGGAFFGAFPTIFYRSLLNSLFSLGYTIIAKPYKFSFRHWSVVIDLLNSQLDLFKMIQFEAEKLDYRGIELYQKYIDAILNPKIVLDKGKYFWLGHSLGCKYIALLELLSILESVDPADAKLRAKIRATADKYGDFNADKTASLTNQSMILLAPVLADLKNAIPIPFLAQLFSPLLKVMPSEKETQDLIFEASTSRNGGRFHYIVDITGFRGDIRAKDTIQWLETFQSRFFGGFNSRLSVQHAPLGPHLSPMGVRDIDDVIIDALIQALAELSLYTQQNLSKES